MSFPRITNHAFDSVMEIEGVVGDLAGDLDRMARCVVGSDHPEHAFMKAVACLPTGEALTAKDGHTYHGIRIIYWPKPGAGALVDIHEARQRLVGAGAVMVMLGNPDPLAFREELRQVGIDAALAWRAARTCRVRSQRFHPNYRAWEPVYRAAVAFGLAKLTGRPRAEVRAAFERLVTLAAKAAHATVEAMPPEDELEF